MNNLEAKVANIDPRNIPAPDITGAYASLINSDLHDDMGARTSAMSGANLSGVPSN